MKGTKMAKLTPKIYLDETRAESWKEPVKTDKKVEKNNWKFIWFIWFVAGIISIASYSLWSFNVWSNTHGLRRPWEYEYRDGLFNKVKFRSFVYDLPEKTVLYPVVTEVKEEKTEIIMDINAVVEGSENPMILRGVYALESSEGKNDGCLDEGLVNGFGYRQNSFEFVCYPDFKSVADKVDSWFTERLKQNGNNLPEALCYYNKGIAGMTTCDYSQNFLRILGEKLQNK